MKPSAILRVHILIRVFAEQRERFFSQELGKWSSGPRNDENTANFNNNRTWYCKALSLVSFYKIYVKVIREYEIRYFSNSRWWFFDYKWEKCYPYILLLGRKVREKRDTTFDFFYIIMCYVTSCIPCAYKSTWIWIFLETTLNKFIIIYGRFIPCVMQKSCEFWKIAPRGEPVKKSNFFTWTNYLPFLNAFKCEIRNGL